VYDTIIIGAGMSGLAAGIRLAQYDQRVCILERHWTIGGLNSFYRLKGRDYDVGLHALTNYTPKGARRGPLAKLLRQLRIRWEEFQLAPQLGSAIRFPGIELDFGNDPGLLESEIAREFPDQIDGYRRLLARLLDYDELVDAAFQVSARTVLEEELSDPWLREMLLCPLMWYGNAREHDMDFGQFCIMFRACYLEGFARPQRGVRLILKQLVRRFRSLGGELKLRHGVSRIAVDGERATGVVLDDGRELAALRIISSAGLVETLRMCDDLTEPAEPQAGRLSFVESVSILDCQPKSLGFDKTIVFYNDSPTFHWERPDDALCDPRTGVICSPNNYDYGGSNGGLPEGVIRLTTLANFDRWSQLDETAYRAAKAAEYQAALAAAVVFMPDFRPHVIATDIFTPTTIRRFTSHDNGAVYGAPEKRLAGTTHLRNLYLCGTDQGFVGIVGAIVSGIQIANRYCLLPTGSADEPV
jgi:phytoene dehydrogenase-like protein